MKRLFGCLLAAALLLCAGCQGTPDASQTPAGTTAPPTQAAVTTAETAEMPSAGETTEPEAAPPTQAPTERPPVVRPRTTESRQATTTRTTPSTPARTAAPTQAPAAQKMKLQRGINVSAMEGDVAADNDVFNPDTYSIIRAAGFDHVRMPVNFASRSGKAPTFTIDPAFFRQLDTAINAALEAGLAVVLDFHGWGAMNGDVDANQDQFYTIWKQVAERYRHYPDSLYFELINEPNASTGRHPLTSERLNELQEEVIAIIRQSNPTRMIVAATAQFNGVWTLMGLRLPADDPNIIVSVHAYDTMEFTHQGATWIGRPAGEVVRLNAEILASVEKTLDAVQRYKEISGREVWLSEFGIYLANAVHTDVTAYLTHFTAQCEKRAIPWAYWEYNSGFGAYDRNGKQWKTYVLDGLIHD